MPPGPIALPILGHFHLLGNSPHKDLYDLAQRYGSIMYLRFGFVPTIVVSSPAAAELVLKTHDLIFANRPYNDVSHHISYGQKGITLGRYSPYLRNMRKLCTMELNQFHPMRREEIGLFVGHLKQDAQASEMVDLSAKISGLGADMICRMVLGRKYADRDINEKGFRAVFMEIMEVA
ncbi:cytochrome P450, partial [Acinetobacter baumannii]